MDHNTVLKTHKVAKQALFKKLTDQGENYHTVAHACLINSWSLYKPKNSYKIYTILILNQINTMCQALVSCEGNTDFEPNVYY